MAISYHSEQPHHKQHHTSLYQITPQTIDNVTGPARSLYRVPRGMGTRELQNRGREELVVAKIHGFRMEFLGSAADQDIKNQFGDLVQDQMALVRESFKYFRQIALIKYEMVTLPRDSDAYQSAKGKVCSLSDDLAFTVRQATRKDEARVKIGPHFICTSTSAPLDSVEAHAHAARMPFANETAESAHFPRSQSSAGVSGLDGTVDYLLELLGSLISLSHPVPVPNTQSIKGNAPTIQIVLIYE